MSLKKAFKKLSKAFKKAIGIKARSKAAADDSAQNGTPAPTYEDTTRSGGEGTFTYKTESKK